TSRQLSSRLPILRTISSPTASPDSSLSTSVLITTAFSSPGTIHRPLTRLGTIIVDQCGGAITDMVRLSVPSARTLRAELKSQLSAAATPVTLNASDSSSSMRCGCPNTTSTSYFQYCKASSNVRRREHCTLVTAIKVAPLRLSVMSVVTSLPLRRNVFLSDKRSGRDGP